MNARRVVAAVGLVAAAAFITTCGDSAQPPTPGWIDVQLTTPNADDGGIVFTVTGAQVDSVRSGFPNAFMRRESASSVRAVVAGSLVNGVVAQILVPDVNALGPYSLTVLEVASRTFQQRAASDYSLQLAGPSQ